MENGKWKVENGKRKTENGKRKKEKRKKGKKKRGKKRSHTGLGSSATPSAVSSTRRPDCGEDASVRPSVGLSVRPDLCLAVSLSVGRGLVGWLVPTLAYLTSLTSPHLTRSPHACLTVAHQARHRFRDDVTLGSRRTREANHTITSVGHHPRGVLENSVLSTTRPSSGVPSLVPSSVPALFQKHD